MDENEIEFKIILRKPIYPVIVVSDNRLYSAFNLKQLAEACISSMLLEGRKYIQVVDTRGEEFWYTPELYSLSPGFAFKKWTKKKIIETYNSSVNAEESSQEYSMKSLSNKRLSKIVQDICELLRA